MFRVASVFVSQHLQFFDFEETLVALTLPSLECHNGQSVLERIELKVLRKFMSQNHSTQNKMYIKVSFHRNSGY